MIICGLDPSLTGTGIAILDAGNPVALHKIGYPGRDGASDLDRNRRVTALTREVSTYVRGFKPDLVIIEGPAYGQSLPSTCDRNGLWHFLMHEFDARHYRYAGITPTCAKRFATGNGLADKKLVVAEVTNWWPHRQLRNDNIADAAVLAAMGAAWARDPLPFELSRLQRESLEVVAWPVMA